MSISSFNAKFDNIIRILNKLILLLSHEFEQMTKLKMFKYYGLKCIYLRSLS